MPSTSLSSVQNIPAEVKQVKQRFSIVGNDPALVNAISRALRVAPIDLSVLIYGESGTGKEFFPKIIHQFSTRKHKKYIAVNCGAIPEGTIDSELFGHEKGSFTGAISSRKGYFEEADGGTIFLDEVAELPLTTQARLLRVLESGEFLKVGSSEVQKTDVRIVAASNVDLLKAVANGKFREDLYYRLSTVRIDVPPLHDRGNDIELLARKFASDFSEKHLMPPITFSPEALRVMEVYRWPGNVRQLKNIVEQLALFDAGEEISRTGIMQLLPIDRSGLSTPVTTRGNHPDYDKEREILWQTLLSLKKEIADIQQQLSHIASGDKTPYPGNNRITSLMKYPAEDLLSTPVHDMNDQSLSRSVEAVEKETVAAALARAGGNKKEAAEELNISMRTLYRKIKDFGLENL